MSQYSHYIYCLKEESTHFGLKISIRFSLEVLAQLGIENYKRKIGNIYKDF